MLKKKRRIYEVFEKLNNVKLNEYYLKEEDFNVDNDKDSRKLHVSLSSTGIADIENEYPEWLVELLISNDFIEEDERSQTWFFTEEGENKFRSPKDLQNWLYQFGEKEEEMPEPDLGTDDMGGDDMSQLGGDDEPFPPLNEGVLNEEERNSIINEFVDFANKHLELSEKQPNIVISQEPNEAAEMFSFGKYTPHSGEIRVVATNRNLADVLRTLAHEMVHFKQHSEDRLEVGSGEDGTDIENEANAEAAVMMRQFGRNNPNIFE